MPHTTESPPESKPCPTALGPACKEGGVQAQQLWSSPQACSGSVVTNSLRKTLETERVSILKPINQILGGWLCTEQAHELTETIPLWLANSQTHLLRLWRLLQTHSPSPHLGETSKSCDFAHFLYKSAPKVTGCSSWILEQKLRAAASQAGAQGDFCWVSLLVFLPDCLNTSASLWAGTCTYMGLAFWRSFPGCNHLSLLITATLLVYGKNSSWVFEFSTKALLHLKHCRGSVASETFIIQSHSTQIAQFRTDSCQIHDITPKLYNTVIYGLMCSIKWTVHRKTEGET